jgi:ubiquinone/menaquinone biosynthesis C-methylase UbiE
VSRTLNFDLLAKPYRWLEYATFGRALERCRFQFLPELTQMRQALVFGDGDGRFLAKLLAANPMLFADVVDISPAMLKRLQKRLAPEAQQRISLHQTDARQFAATRSGFDLVVTHFFLDCLSTEEVMALIEKITPHLESNAIWIVSEFAIPQGRLTAVVGRVVISSLYRLFGCLTGLPVRVLPNYTSALQKAGFCLIQEKPRLFGLLVSQHWQRAAASARQPVID